MPDEETVRFVWYTETTVLVTRFTDIDSFDQKPVYARADGGRLVAKAVKESKRRQAAYTEEEKSRAAQSTDVKLAELSVFDADGREVAPHQLRKSLADSKPVVVSSNGSIVDPFFLSMLKEDALVFVSRSPDFPPALTRPLPPPPTQPSPSDAPPQAAGVQLRPAAPNLTASQSGGDPSAATR
jgi:hypothetical protein